MKKLLLILIVAAGGLVAIPTPAQAPTRDIDGLLVDQRIKRITTALSLTDDQKTRIRPLLLEEIKAFKSYREDATLTEPDRIKKENEFRATAKPKFKVILNEEQLAKYEQLQQGKRVKPPAK